MVKVRGKGERKSGKIPSNMQCSSYHFTICNQKTYLVTQGACLLTVQDFTGKLAKRNYVSEQPKKEQTEVGFFHLASLSADFHWCSVTPQRDDASTP